MDEGKLSKVNSLAIIYSELRSMDLETLGKISIFNIWIKL